LSDDILREQVDYYRARAQEYDQSILEADFFASGGENEEGGALAVAARRLSALGPFERALELACGTGIWTQVLVTIAKEVTAVDAAPEMLEIARSKLGDANVSYEQADLFEWQPTQEYDLVFFGFWLSHVPPEALDPFLENVWRAVRPGGKLVIIDEYAPTDEDRLVATDDMHALRPLNDGRTFTIVKVFYDLGLLEERLARLGFAVKADKLDKIFFFLSASCGTTDTSE
jgi:ubiquinone/menaquinone biosynthesis C-methylase UbiE